MIRRNYEEKPIAYSGKYIDYKGNDYMLIPEIKRGICQGCCFEDNTNFKGCDNKLVRYCNQGFLFKKVEHYVCK